MIRDTGQGVSLIEKWGDSPVGHQVLIFSHIRNQWVAILSPAKMFLGDPHQPEVDLLHSSAVVLLKFSVNLSQ